jgi:hypothetical protein
MSRISCGRGPLGPEKTVSGCEKQKTERKQEEKKMEG